MKKENFILFLVLWASVATSHAQQNCIAGKHNLITTGGTWFQPGFMSGTAITVSDTATIEYFKAQGAGNGDSVKMALYAYQSGQVGSLITHSVVGATTNGVISLEPTTVVTVFPGRYYIMAKAKGLVGFSTKHFERTLTTNSYAYYTSSGWNSIWPLATATLDSFCCSEFKFWLEMKCCPRRDTIVASACESYTSPSGKHLYTETGIYTDTVLPQPYMGCDTLVVIDLTIAEFDTTLVQNGFTLSTQDTGSTYQWMDCDSGTIIPGAIDSSYTDSTGGNFAVIINKNGCIDTSVCYAISGIGLEEHNGPTISVYPNPAEDHITVECSDPEARLELYSMTGKVLDLRIEQIANGYRIQLPSSPGVYSLKLTTDEFIRFFKILKR